MIGWWAALSPAVRRAILYGVLAAAVAGSVFYLVQRYGVTQWSRGEQQGRMAATQELLRAKEAEWKEKEAGIRAQALQNEADRAANGIRAAEINRARQALGLNVDATLRQIEAEYEKNRGSIGALHGTDLDAAIRRFIAGYAEPAIK